MILYVNNRGEIKDVNSTTQIGLTAIIVPEEENPFEGWSIARILCYKVFLDRDNNVGGYTPYIDSRIVEQLDKLDLNKQSQIDEANIEIVATQEAAVENFETQVIINDTVQANAEAIVELYELIANESETEE